MKIAILIGILIMLALAGCGQTSSLSLAGSSTPQDDWDFRGVYALYNASNVSSAYYCDDAGGDCVNLSTLRRDTTGSGGTGDITSVTTSSTSGLQGGDTAGDVDLLVNVTYFHNLIDARSTNDTDTNETTRIEHLYDYDVTNRSNWDEAHSWGDHSLAGYITSLYGYFNSNDNVSINTGQITDYNDSDTTYSAGEGLSLVSTTFSVSGNITVTGVLVGTGDKICANDWSCDHYIVHNGSGWVIS